MSNIHNAGPGPNSENPDSSLEAEENKSENADNLDSESMGHSSPRRDSDPTIKNH